jgi:hypothetical protein
MNETTKKTIITGVSVLLITAGVFFVSRAIIKKLQAKREDEIASSGEQDEQGSGDTLLTPSEEAEAKNYNPASDAKYIYDRIKGWKVPFVYYDEEVNAMIAKQTDAKLKKLAQYYKSKYKKSLWLALDEEWDYYSGNQYLGSMNRLSSLGLR